MIAGCVLFAAFVAIHFPYATDAPLTAAEIAKSTAFYQQAYAAPTETANADEDQYIQAATAAAEGWHIKDRLAGFTAAQHLENKRVLEVGSGRGYLQDVVGDYTGLDISPSVGRFYHKPFVLGLRDGAPLPDNSYDARLVHLGDRARSQPRTGLPRNAARREERRLALSVSRLELHAVGRPGLRRPSVYRSGSRRHAGQAARFPSSEHLYQASYTAPHPDLRWLSYEALRAPTTLHYRRLTPNYDKFWEGDGDAVNSLDRYEALLWFLSRGDECLNCTAPNLFRAIAEHVTDPRLIIRVHKS